MRTRDPEAKRKQLFDGALAEFAEFGLAGARVERLAKRAGVSAGLVYSFYDGKDGLFDAVFDQIVELAVAAVPIDADDLPGYAARLYDSGIEHPEIARFMAWYRLEHPGQSQRGASAAAMTDKVAAIADAQRRGTVTGAMPAGQILAAVLAVANMWNQPSEDLHALVPEDNRRQAVIDTVARLVAA